MAVPVGVLLSPFATNLDILGVSHRWDKNAERLKTVTFGRHLKVSKHGWQFGDTWLNLNCAVQLPGPLDNGRSFYVHDGRFYRLLFTRLFARWK